MASCLYIIRVFENKIYIVRILISVIYIEIEYIQLAL